MKFLIEVDSKWPKSGGMSVDSEADRSFYPHLHGPFVDELTMTAYMQRKWPNNKETMLLVLDGHLATVPHSPLERPETDKCAPDEKNWTKVGQDKWTCNACGATIMAVRVAHPIWDGPFLCSGSGEVESEEVGYCPNCDKKPGFQGAPIQR